jgi:hypothetical protein
MHTELSLYIVEAADLLRKGALEGGRLGVELASRQSTIPSQAAVKLLEQLQSVLCALTSLKSMTPSSPSDETTSRPISLAM